MKTIQKVHDMSPSTFRISFDFQCKLLASDWIAIAVADEVKARYAWFKPLLPFPDLSLSLELRM